MECKWRILVEKGNGNEGLEKAVDIALGTTSTILIGQFRQKFECGLCSLLTQNDMGPMECQQPDHNENTCPDIEEYRTV